MEPELWEGTVGTKRAVPWFPGCSNQGALMAVWEIRSLGKGSLEEQKTKHPILLPHTQPWRR